MAIAAENEIEEVEPGLVEMGRDEKELELANELAEENNEQQEEQQLSLSVNALDGGQNDSTFKLRGTLCKRPV